LRHKGEGDYALLPAHDVAGEDDDNDNDDGVPKAPTPPPKRGWLW